MHAYVKWLTSFVLATQLTTNPLYEYEPLGYGTCPVMDIELPCILMTKDGELYIAIYNQDKDRLLWIIRTKDNAIIYDFAMEELDRELERQHIRLK